MLLDPIYFYIKLIILKNRIKKFLVENICYNRFIQDTGGYSKWDIDFQDV